MTTINSSQNYCQKLVKKIKFDFYKVDKFAPKGLYLLEWQGYWHARKRKRLEIIKQYIMTEKKRIGRDEIPKVGKGFMIDCDYWELQSKEWQKENSELCRIPFNCWRYKFFEVINVKYKKPSCVVKWKVTVVESKNEV